MDEFVPTQWTFGPTAELVFKSDTNMLYRLDEFSLIPSMVRRERAILKALLLDALEQLEEEKTA